MKNTVLAFTFFISILGNVYANDEVNLPTSYREKAIYFQSGWGGVAYIKNGEEKDVGFFYSALKDEIVEPPEAANLLGDGIFNMKVGMVTTFSSLIAGVAAAPVTGGISMLVGMAGYFLGISEMVAGGNKMQKAIWIYNGSVLTTTGNSDVASPNIALN